MSYLSPRHESGQVETGHNGPEQGEGELEVDAHLYTLLYSTILEVEAHQQLGVVLLHQAHGPLHQALQVVLVPAGGQGSLEECLSAPNSFKDAKY